MMRSSACMVTLWPIVNVSTKAQEQVKNCFSEREQLSADDGPKSHRSLLSFTSRGLTKVPNGTDTPSAINSAGSHGPRVEQPAPQSGPAEEHPSVAGFIQS